MITLSTRAGTYPRSSVCACTSRLRSAASIAAGVVFCSDHDPSISPARAISRLDRAPLVVVQQDRVLLGRAGRARLVLRDRAALLLPALEDRIDDPPRGLHL